MEITRKLTLEESEIFSRECEEIEKRAYSGFKKSIKLGFVTLSCSLALGILGFGKGLYNDLTRPAVPLKENQVALQTEDKFVDYSIDGCLIGTYAGFGSIFYGLHCISPGRITKKRRKALRDLIQNS